MDGAYVVPIRKPSCSGEGHQDNVFTFTVPTDFNNLGSRVPGFTGCKTPGDCVLQVYAHSVESRMYASGTPLVVAGTVPAATAAVPNVAAAVTEVGLSIEQLPRRTCLPSNDPSVNIATSVPRVARLVSDQFNHAYQNSGAPTACGALISETRRYSFCHQSARPPQLTSLLWCP